MNEEGHLQAPSRLTEFNVKFLSSSPCVVDVVVTEILSQYNKLEIVRGHMRILIRLPVRSKRFFKSLNWNDFVCMF